MSRSLPVGPSGGGRQAKQAHPGQLHRCVVNAGSEDRRQGLEVVFGHPLMNIAYASREEARAWMTEMGTSESKYLEGCGAVRQPVSKLHGGDVIVRLGMADGMPRIALALDDEVLLTSDPVQGPHWIGAKDLRRRARVFRFGYPRQR